MDLEAFELVILRRSPDATEYDDETLARIQRAHLAHYESLRAAGNVVTNGPVIDQPDEMMRGIAIFRTGSVEESRKLAEQDPAVVAGRLAIEIMTYWCRPGTLTPQGKAVSVPDP